MAERKRVGAEVNSFCAFLLVEGAVDDLLKQSALAYQELLPYRYHVALGRKGTLRRISVCFPEVAYHHLAGFHKAGFEALRIKHKALSVALAGKISHAHFQKAGISLEDRWRGICCLKETIETNRAVFHYRGHEQTWSCIEADYLMVNGRINFFISGETPESIFEHDGPDEYWCGCPRLTTLQIVREEVTSGERVLIFQAPSYHE